MDLNFILMDETEQRECMIKNGKEMVRSGKAWIGFCDNNPNISKEALSWIRDQAKLAIGWGSYLVRYNQLMLERDRQGYPLI